MPISRRQVLAGSAVSAAALASGFPAPAIAQSEPIKIGYLPALTGPSSSTGVGINRGTQLAVELINKEGGIKGRKIELIVRDTQSDPTKAVNAVAELTQRAKASMIFGPLNSGEALAATPLIRSEEHTSELQSLEAISYAVFCLTRSPCWPASASFSPFRAVATIAALPENSAGPIGRASCRERVFEAV